VDCTHPHAAGLVDAWFFTEGIGYATNALTSNLFGKITGATWGFSGADTRGRREQCVTFGSNPAGGTATQYIDCGSSSYLAQAKTMTCEVLVSFIGLSGVAEMYSGAFLARTNNQAGVNTWEFITFPGGSTVFTRATTQPTVGTWYIVHMTWDGAHGHIYINGVEQAYSLQQTATGNLGTSTLTIGANGSHVEALNASLGRILVWNRILSVPEIQSRIDQPYGFILPTLPHRVLPFGLAPGTFLYTGSGGAVSGGAAAKSVNPRRYSGSGGAVSGGAAVTTHVSYGGGAPYRGVPPWQKPGPFFTFDPTRVDLSKLPLNVVDIWLLNEGAGTRVTSLLKGHTGLLTGSWSGSSTGGPGVNFESNPNTGNINEVALANIQTTQSTPEALGLVGGHEFSYEVLIRHEKLTWGSGTGVGKSEIVALDGTGTIHEDGLFNGAIDIGCICIEAYTTVANGFIGAWRTFADFSHTLPDGKWTLVHCVWRYGGSDGFGKGHIYFDGREISYQLQETPPSDGVLTSRGLPLTIGSALDVTHTNIGGDPWPGMLSHLIIWNRGLTDAEIRSRVHDQYNFIRQEQHKHTFFKGVVLPGTHVRNVGQHAATSLGGSVRTVPESARVSTGVPQPVPQTMVIMVDTKRTVPQTMALDKAKRTVPQFARLTPAHRLILQNMAIAVEQIRHIPQYVALSPFIRTIPQHMEISPANVRMVAQTMRLSQTHQRTFLMAAVLQAKGVTQTPRVVLQHMVVKSKGKHTPPRTNARVMAQNAILSATERRVVQYGALRQTRTRTVFQFMLLSIAASRRTVPESAQLRSTSIRTVPEQGAVQAFKQRTVAQHAALSVVPGRFIRTVPETTILSEGGVRVVPQTMALADTGVFARIVHELTVLNGHSIRTVTEHASVGVLHIRTVTEHAKLSEAALVRHVPQRAALGSATTVSTRGIPIISVRPIPKAGVSDTPIIEVK
jgi:hypothetical protein